MRSMLIISAAIVAGLLLTFGVYRFTTSDGQSADSLLVQDAGRGGRFGDRGGGPGGFGGGPGARGDVGAFRGGGMMAGRTGFDELVLNVAELNLEPDFNLSIEQERKIKTLRAEVKAAWEKWRKDNEPELQKIQEQFRQLREAGNRDGFRELADKRQALEATAPKNETAEKQLRAILTEEQLKQLDAFLAVKKAEQDAQRQQMMDRFGGGPGGFGGQGGQGGDQQGQPGRQGRGNRNDRNAAPNAAPQGGQAAPRQQ